MANEMTLIPGQELDLRESALTREQAAAGSTGATQLEPLPPLEPLAAPEPKGLSTPAKVGVGVGVAGATGLAAWGLYRLGERMGWWGGPTIVFDDSEAPKKDTAPPIKKKGRATGRPPNMSGDSAGYNTTLWNSPGPVRLALVSQGYKVAVSHDPLAEDGQGNAQVRRLQEDWNKVIRGIDSGKVKLPSGVDKPKLLDHFRGILVVDGIPGKNTLNALEVVFTNYRDNGVFWKSKLLEQAR